ncbi:adrenocortical dysplasia protein homolog [Xiphias gladius]|uniref:adrenocortical dysplasia protein homolog n=1 Tax=Xiphias gladius TaxID=8245 RepID=UPI001A99E2A3|nr:adrenocortical dysplasia protein homolog [Xiphias gladius]
MPRPSRSKLSPWIENLILSYGSQEGNSSSGRLKAHVIGVGQMSQSQAQGAEGPTGLLFLSDGVLQIPAILTASAWEHLQEQEDRECFTSLVNTTVCIQDYRLQFHMALEQIKCRFFLLVGELATTAAGPVKDNTPCFTTLPSVRLKISKTWRALLGQEAQDSQKSQCGFDLSELLGEWQHDFVQAVLEDVQEKLMVASSSPESPQPSTSLLTHPNAFSAPSWDVDRVRYKGVKCFSVPIQCLLIQEEDAQQLQMPPNFGNRTLSGLSAAYEDRKRDLPQDCRPSDTTQPSVDDAEWQIAKPAVAERDCDIHENSPLPVEHCMLYEGMIAQMVDSDIGLLANPWNIFPPPCDTSSSPDVSPEATPTNTLHKPTAAKPKPDHAEILTSTQLPVHSPKESQQTSEHSKGEHSYFPPYQKPLNSAFRPATASSSTSTSVSPPKPFSRPSNLSPSTDDHCTFTAQQNLLALEQENEILEKDIEETIDRKYRNAKRKRSKPIPGALTTLLEEQEEEAHISGNPQSWLFHSQVGSVAKEGSSYKKGQTAGTLLRNAPTVHSNSRLFPFSYQVSLRNLQDFSRIKVAESLLHWAVKYLVVPKDTDNPHNMSVTSERTEVI